MQTMLSVGTYVYRSSSSEFEELVASLRTDPLISNYFICLSLLFVTIYIII